MRRLKRCAGVGAALAVGGIFLYYAFRDIRPGDVTGALADFRPVWVPVLLGLPLLDLWIRAVRWRLLLAPLAQAGVLPLAQMEAIGLAVNNVLFLRLGELARGIVAARELKVPAMSVLATIAVERLCDMAALLFLFVAGASFMPEVIDSGVRASAAGLTLLVLAAIAASAVGGERLAGAAARRIRWPALGRAAGDLARGTRALRSWAVCLQVAFWSLALWICDAALMAATGASMGLEPSLGLGRGIVVLCTAAAGTVVPTVPGAFGNFELAVRFILERFGYEKGLAVSFAALSHLIGYVLVTGVGIASLYRLGHTFTSLRRALSEAAAEGRP